MQDFLLLFLLLLLLYFINEWTNDKADIFDRTDQSHMCNVHVHTRSGADKVRSKKLIDQIIN